MEFDLCEYDADEDDVIQSRLSFATIEMELEPQVGDLVVVEEEAESVQGSLRCIYEVRGRMFFPDLPEWTPLLGVEQVSSEIVEEGEVGEWTGRF